MKRKVFFCTKHTGCTYCNGCGANIFPPLCTVIANVGLLFPMTEEDVLLLVLLDEPPRTATPVGFQEVKAMPVFGRVTSTSNCNAVGERLWGTCNENTPVSELCPQFHSRMDRLSIEKGVGSLDVDVLNTRES